MMPPQGAAIDPTSGVFIWTPAVGAGSWIVTVRVTDDGCPAFSDLESFALNVTPVTKRVIPGVELKEGVLYVIGTNGDDRVSIN